MISSSLDIDFFPGDIHDRSFKKINNFTLHNWDVIASPCQDSDYSELLEEAQA